MRKKIAVVGDKGSVLGFKSVGFEVFMTTTQQETREVMQALCKADYGIIFITEQAYLQVPEIIDEYKERPTPAIIPIPGKDGNLGIGIKNVNDRLRIYFGPGYGLSINSVPDEGTTVTIRMPQVPADREGDYDKTR